VQSHLADVGADLLAEADDSFKDHEPTVRDVLETVQEFSLSFLLQNFLVNLEDLMAGVFDLRFQCRCISPVDIPRLILPLDPVLELTLSLGGQVFLK